MTKVTRTQFAGALRARYGLDPSVHRKFVALLWDEFSSDAEDGAIVEELVRSVETHVRAYFLGSNGASRVTGIQERTAKMDLTAELGGTDDFFAGRGRTDPKSVEREWVGRHVSAISEYLSKILAVDEGVIDFRTRALGSPTATLTPEQAARVVRSPAAASLSFAYFESHSVSLTDHNALIEKHGGAEEVGDASRNATITVKPAGGGETIHKDLSNQDATEVLYWPGVGEEAVVERIKVRDGSVLGELRALGKRLSDRHPWQLDQVINFVLTGSPQLASTLQGTIRSSFNNGVKAHKYDTKTIVLEAEHWVPADEVARAYRKLQREAHGGKEKRKSSDRNIEVFRHVVHLSDVKIVSADENLAKLVIPTWRDMLKRWNKEHPAGTAWHYEDETGQAAKLFQRDYKRGQREVIGRATGLPGEKGQPMTRSESMAHFAGFLKRLSAGPAS